MADKKIIKPKPISGFPEWTPSVRRIEQQWLDHIRHVFESYGFCNIETPAVEELDVLLSKGETDKEIYALQRLQADEKDTSDARLGLHFDLTVPFARYTAQNFNELAFPFKRYQIQKVWRGERPQEGRFREFYQCDIDVINPDSLPLYFDAEMPLIIDEILQEINVGDYEIKLSNRKILDGYLQGLNIENRQMAMRILDKRDKIGVEGVIKELLNLDEFDKEKAEKATQIATICTSDDSFAQQVRALGVSHPLLDEGIEELAFVMKIIAASAEAKVTADLSIVRGFDYYTGTVYEAKLLDYPEYGSIVSGGRYEDLAGSYINKKLPGVGISLGLTRLFAKMLKEDKIPPAERISPADVLVVLPSEDQRTTALKTAASLRSRGIKTEVYHAPQKIKKQMAYAEKKGIPHVWFPPFDEGGQHEVKNMASGEQKPGDPSTWQPGS